jgi:hypothetical protein
MNRGYLWAGIFALCIAALMTVQPLADASADGDQVSALKSWAVEYAIEQQRASKFQLTPYEEMESGDLRRALEGPLV